MIRAGLIILVLSWVPLLIVGLLDPNANPIGLGLLAWLGSLIALIIIAIGGLRRLLVALKRG
jgi:hypothetical protein